jgi:hypothetical protein
MGGRGGGGGGGGGGGESYLVSWILFNFGFQLVQRVNINGRVILDVLVNFVHQHLPLFIQCLCSFITCLSSVSGLGLFL